jgi:amidase
MNTEIAESHRALFSKHKDQYGHWLRTAIESGMSEASTERTKSERSAYRYRFLQMFRSGDLLMIPATPFVTPTWADIDRYLEPGPNMIRRFTALINVAGAPSLTLPCGFSRDGSPIGLQLVGPHHPEPLLLRVGQAYQKLTDWHLKHPI